MGFHDSLRSSQLGNHCYIGEKLAASEEAVDGTLTVLMKPSHTHVHLIKTEVTIAK